MEIFERLSGGRRSFDASDWRRWRKPALLALIGLLLLIGALSAFYTVEPQGKAVVKRFGKVVAIREPGLHWKLPFGIDTAQFVPTERVLKQEFGFRTAQTGGRRTVYADGRGGREWKDESLMLTGDLNVIDVEWVVQYRIRDPNQYLHQVQDQEGTIRDISESVMRRIVGNRLGSDVLTIGRVEIAADVRKEMQAILDSYEMGVHVSAVELQDVTPPDPVKPSFDEVNEARQEKERLVNLAEKERNRVIPRARGEAEQTISEAQAYAAERGNVAKGESARFTSIYEQYKVAPDVTRQRLFLETIDDVSKGLGGLYVMGENTPAPLPLFDLNRAAEQRAAARPPADGSAAAPSGAAARGAAASGTEVRR